MRTIEPIDLVKLHDRLATVARAIIEGGSEAAPLIFVAKIDEKPGMLAEFVPIDPKQSQQLLDSKVGKASLMAVVRTLVTQDPQAIVAHVTEAWGVHFSDDEAGRKAYAEYRASGKRIEDRPDRSERLMVMLHTAAGSFAGMHEIKTDAAGKRSVEIKPLALDQDFGGLMTLNEESEHKRWTDTTT